MKYNYDYNNIPYHKVSPFYVSYIKIPLLVYNYLNLYDTPEDMLKEVPELSVLFSIIEKKLTKLNLGKYCSEYKKLRTKMSHDEITEMIIKIGTTV